MFQSVADSAPVVVASDILIPNTPVELSYESGPSAERAVSPILFDTVPESDRRSEFVFASAPESVLILMPIFAIDPESAFCARASVK
jgi:hypothetical protein